MHSAISNPEMGSATHLALHPFDRVPILQHGDFTLYETSAIATYVDEAFEGPALQPKDVRGRARMNQWISSVNSYYYPYMIYHVTHERLVFPQLGIASDEKVVAHALPKIERGLEVIEKALGHGAAYILGSELTLADFFMLPSTYAFGLTDEGKASIQDIRLFRSGVRGWKRCRRSSAFAPPFPRVILFSTPASGPFRTARNTDPAEALARHRRPLRPSGVVAKSPPVAMNRDRPRDNPCARKCKISSMRSSSRSGC
jgi:glutathione S-transferase